MPNCLLIRCADNYLTPPKFIYEKEKAIRVCDHCFKLSQNMIKKLNHGDILLNFPRGHGRGKFKNTLPSFSLVSVDTTLFSLNVNLSFQLNNIIDRVTDHIFKSVGVSSNWNDLLKDFIVRALDEVQPDTISENDSMQLIDYIKIKKIPFADTSETAYVQGLLIRKNISYKKMATEIPNPRIMMIASSLDPDESDGITNLEHVIENEKANVTSIIKNLVKFRPNVIFVEKTVNWRIQELLRKNEITVIFKLKPNQFKRIARATNCKVITNPKHLNESESAKLVGQCAYFQVKSLENQMELEKAKSDELSTKSLHFDPTLMKLDGCNPAKGVTIAISGPNYSELKLVKEGLREIFLKTRNFVLEKEVILQEIYLYFRKDEIKQALLAIEKARKMNEDSPEETLLEDERNFQEIISQDYKEVFNFTQIASKQAQIAFQNLHLLNYRTVTSAGYFINFLTDDRELLKAINQDSLSFTKVNYVIMNFEDHPDLDDLSKPETEQIERNLAANRYKKVDHLTQICSVPKYKTNTCYTKSDISLGDYIKRRAEMLYTRCELCNRPRYYHTAVVYKDNCYIKIATQVTGPAKDAIMLEFRRQNNMRRKETSNARSSVRYSMSSNYQENLSERSRNNSSANLLLEEEEEKSGNIFTRYLRTFSNFIGGGESKRKSSMVIKLPKGFEGENSDSSPPPQQKVGSPLNNSPVYHHHPLLDKELKINTYLECNRCKRKVTDEFELSKVYLEYSLTRFLEQFIRNHHKYKNGLAQANSMDDLTPQRSETITNLDQADSPVQKLLVIKPGSCCMTSTKSRVFRYNEVLIKFTSGQSQVYKVIEYRNTDAITKEILRVEYDKLLKAKANYCSTLLKSYLNFVLEKLKKLIEELIENTQIHITYDEIDLVKDIFNKNNPLSLEPINIVLKDTATINGMLLGMRNRIDASFAAEFESYLEIEKLRRSFFLQIYEICEEFYKIREEVLEQEKKSGDDFQRRNTLSRAPSKRKDEKNERPRSETVAEGLQQILNTSNGKINFESVPALELNHLTNSNVGFSKLDSPDSVADDNKSISEKTVQSDATAVLSLDGKSKATSSDANSVIQSPGVLIPSKNPQQIPKIIITEEEKKEGAEQQPEKEELEFDKVSLLSAADMNTSSVKKSNYTKRSRDVEDDKERDFIDALSLGLIPAEPDTEDIPAKKHVSPPYYEYLFYFLYPIALYPCERTRSSLCDRLRTK